MPVVWLWLPVSFLRCDGWSYEFQDLKESRVCGGWIFLVFLVAVTIITYYVPVGGITQTKTLCKIRPRKRHFLPEVFLWITMYSIGSHLMKEVIIQCPFYPLWSGAATSVLILHLVTFNQQVPVSVPACPASSPSPPCFSSSTILCPLLSSSG